MKNRKSAALGQNFLVNRGVARKIVSNLRPIQQSSNILEIGPGKGVLTELIIEQLGNGQHDSLTAVDIDNNLTTDLGQQFPDISILNKNIVDVVPDDFNCQQIQLIGNVPYYISKEIVDWIIKNNKYIESGVLMFQREFVDKIIKVGNPKYKSPQGLLFKYLYDSHLVMHVNRGSFSPPPKIMSTVFKFARVEATSHIKISDFYTFLKAGFSHRRKTLMNNLGHQLNQNLSSIFDELSLDKSIRAEHADLNDFIRLYSAL